MASVGSAISASTYASGFKITGLASDLDTESIITQLMSIQERPIKTLENKQTEITEKLTAWRSFNTRFQAFTTSVDDLTDAESFKGGTVTSSNEEIMKAKTSGAVASGSYSVTVKSLASTHQVSSQGFTSASDSVGTGTVTIKVGSASFEPITLEAGNNSLTALKDKINSGSYGVTASIVNTGGTTPQSKLVLTSNTTGTKGEISITSNLTGGTSPAFTQIQAAKDAHIVLGSAGDGSTPIDIYSSSNTVTDVIPGVTLELKSADETKAVNITVEQSTSAAKTAVNNFISQFNNLVTFFDDQFYYDATTEKTGTLFSDTTLLNVKNTLYEMVTNRYGTGSGISDLSKMGIELNNAGKLAVTDSDALEAALKNNSNGVIQFFTDKTNGFGTKLNEYVESTNDSVNGVFTTTEEYYNDEIADIENQITNKQAYLEKVKQTYTIKFAAMESAMATLKGQADYLDAQFAAMKKSRES